MILVDTCIWILHNRVNDAILFKLLEEDRIITHPFVIGELAMGSLARREAFLISLRKLPVAESAHHEEVLSFVAEHQLFSSGIGYIDASLLVAAKLTNECVLWTRDKKLLAVAERLNLAWHEPKSS